MNVRFYKDGESVRIKIQTDPHSMVDRLKVDSDEADYPSQWAIFQPPPARKTRSKQKDQDRG